MRISAPQPVLFSAVFLSSVTVAARAVATVASTGACVVSLATSGQDGVQVSGSATVNASSCNIYDYSIDPKALEVKGGNATLEAKDVYIAGGYNSNGTFTVSGTLKPDDTGMPSPPDPYCNYPTDTPPACANRTTPTVGACGTNPLTAAGNGAPTNYQWPQQVNTSAATAVGQYNLTFASSGNNSVSASGAAVGSLVWDQHSPAAIPSGTTVTAVTATTVTLSNPVASPGVGNGDQIIFSLILYPGVYCSDINPNTPLTMSPGVYILAGTSFKPGGGSSTDPVLNTSTDLCTSSTGKTYVNAPGGVTIYFGPNPNNSSQYGNIQVSTCVSITAPATGSTAGIAFWQDGRTNNGQDAFNGGSSLYVTGAIYAPSSEVTYTGSTTGASSCTQIVAATVNFNGSATLNSSCSGTGVLDAGGKIALAE